MKKLLRIHCTNKQVYKLAGTRQEWLIHIKMPICEEKSARLHWRHWNDGPCWMNQKKNQAIWWWSVPSGTNLLLATRDGVDGSDVTWHEITNTW